MRRAGTFISFVLLGLVAAAPAAAAPAVTNQNDAGAGSLRNAIANAAPGDTITVPAGTYTLASELQSQTVTPLTIAGAGARTTKIVVPPGSNWRIFDIGADAVTISGLTLSGGSVNNTTVQQGPHGGAIYQAGGSLTLDHDALTGNTATATAAGGAAGGAIYDAGALTIRASSLSGNMADGGAGSGTGGAIEAQSSLAIVNTTIAGNAVKGPGAGGGGVYATGPSSLSSDTIAGNTAQGPGGFGGNVYLAGGAATLRDTIISGGAPNNCVSAGGSFTSAGYNLESTTPSQCGLAAATVDQVGFDPQLATAAPANNGGPTDTIALAPASPAINAGNPSGCTDGVSALTTDQRDVSRPQGARCDIGAFEFRAPIVASAPHVGAAFVGVAATCSGAAFTAPDGGSLSALAFTWLRDGSPIPGATGPSYTPAAGDLGHALSCAVAATGTAGSATATSAPVTVRAVPIVCGAAGGGCVLIPATLRIVSITRRRDGSAVIAAAVNLPGSISATATARIPRRHRRPRTVTAARATTTARGASTVRLVLRATGAARTQLRRTHRLAIAITIAYAPVARPVQRVRRSTTLRVAVKRRRHR